MQAVDAYKSFGVSRPAEKRWDPLDPRAETLEELRAKADAAECQRMATLWMKDARAAIVKEQEKRDRDEEVEVLLREHGHQLRKPPKSYISAEELKEVARLQDTDPAAAKQLMEKLRRKEVLGFQEGKRGAKFGYGMEVMCDNCKRFFLTIQRCSKCHMAWYCSNDCQKEDWRTHRHVCHEEYKKRKALEAASRASSMQPTPVGTPVMPRLETPTPEGLQKKLEQVQKQQEMEEKKEQAKQAAGGEQKKEAEKDEPWDDKNRERVDVIDDADLTEDAGGDASSSAARAALQQDLAKTSQKVVDSTAAAEAGAESKKEKKKDKKTKKKKKERVVIQGSQDPATLDPDMQALEEAQEEILGRVINKINLKQFTDKERHGYQNLLSDQMRDVIEGMWKAFHLAGLVPVDGAGQRRTVREMFKFSGSKPEFVWLAKRGQEWVNQYNKDPNSPLDKKISAWLKEYMKQEGYKADEEGRIDYQTFVRMLCARAVDYRCGK